MVNVIKMMDFLRVVLGRDDFWSSSLKKEEIKENV